MTERELAGRLALGTAQFGLAYGINNVAGQPSLAAVASLLDAAAAAGLTLLDTAAAYGDSEARLGTLLAERPAGTFQLVTKILPTAELPAPAAIETSLARLGQPTVAGLLLHAFSHAAEPANWTALAAARAAGQATSVGVSLYHPTEAQWLLDHPDVPCTLIQVPLNVFDQRLLPLLPALAARGIEVHVRSAFLQGLLLRDPAALPAFFGPLAPKLTRLRALATEAGIPLPALLLLFVAQTPGVARVVIGVDSEANLRENLAAAAYAPAAEALRPALTALAEETDTFILPYSWPKTT